LWKAAFCGKSRTTSARQMIGATTRAPMAALAVLG